jgi:diguanylate cyclase (GGDEF)-like protein
LKDESVAHGLRKNSSLVTWNSGVLLVSSQTLWYGEYVPPSEAGNPGRINLTLFTPKQIKPGHITSIYKDRRGDLWAGCDDDICRFTINQWVHQNLAAGLTSESWSDFLESTYGGLWARGQHHILYLPADGHHFEDRTTNLTTKLFRNGGVMEDPSGRLLISTVDEIVWWDGKKWAGFNQVELKHRSQVFPLLADREGNLWLGVNGHGLLRSCGYDEWESWTEEEGIAGDVVFGITRDHAGRIWLATTNGLLMSPPPYRKFQRAGDGSSTMVALQAVMTAMDGSVWAAGMSQKIMRVDPKTFQTEAIKVTDSARYVDSLLEMADGSVWAGTSTGISIVRRERGRLTSESVRDPLMNDRYIFKLLHAGNGDILVLANSGLFRYSGGHWSQIILPPDLRELEFSDFVLLPDGQLLLVGESTAVQLRIAGDSAIDSRILSSDDVPFRAVQFAGHDTAGNLWLGGDEGLARNHNDNWRTFTTEDGLVWDDTDARAFYADPDGSVWIGTSGGLSHFRAPEPDISTSVLHEPLVEAHVGGHAIFPDSIQRIASKNATLAATFSSRSYRHESAIAFHYRLNGLEETWTTSADGQIRYSNLSPGFYTLEVETVDKELHLKSKVSQITFIVLAPWWQRWPIELLALIATGIFLQQLVRLRIRQLVQRRALEEQATKDSLTRVWNRNAGMEILERELSRASREQAPILIALADIDHFKRINDTFGHIAGDIALRATASRLQGSVRTYDTVVRYGGEEFLLILPGVKEEDAWQRMAQIHQSVRTKPVMFEAQPISVTCSFGAILVKTVESENPAYFIQQADRALYQAKNAGRDRIEFANLDAAEPK